MEPSCVLRITFAFTWSAVTSAEFTTVCITPLKRTRHRPPEYATLIRARAAECNNGSSDRGSWIRFVHSDSRRPHASPRGVCLRRQEPVSVRGWEAAYRSEQWFGSAGRTYTGRKPGSD